MNSRKEFEHNAFLLAERLRTGKMQFSKDTQRMVSGIRSVRHLPNQRIDLHTIDESARMAMNMAANFEYRFDKEKN